ncbi:MAG: hypothetical protein K6G75_06280 [Lachnospiraceae bacterium]|nr:hypothetical protein [Lachnospiraceae bacterium]
MKKMLYMCAVEWKWIAQRPQFLEMELEKDYEITVLSPVHAFKKIKTQKNTTLPERFKEFSLLPYQEKVGAISGLSKALFKGKVKNFDEYDIVWLGSALFGKYIPEDYKGIVVFDYMDDCISMQSNPKMKEAYSSQQAKLVERADLICASSQYLIGLLPESTREKTILIRNAFRGKDIIPPAEIKPENIVKIGYVGTIAEWMDWKLLEKCREVLGNVVFHFWGPENSRPDNEEGFVFHGVVEHSAIPNEIKDMHALMMPFVVNDIVKAVDPVKLYEYISYGKNIISVQYDEVKRFGEYVWLYKDEETFIELVKGIGEGKIHCKYDSASQSEFLKENTWSHRAEEVKKGIDSL